MDDQNVLLARLAKEFMERLRRGESPDVEEYAGQYPDFAEEIRRLFGTLLVMERQLTDDAPDAGDEPESPHTGHAEPAGEDDEVEKVDGSASTIPASGKKPGQTQVRRGVFGDYELLEKIGSGGMGVVYRARQRSLNRVVALKMIKTGQFASDEEILRFRSEAEAAANLRHPNLVSIHEVGELQGQHYFSMDYIPGSNLAEMVGQNDISFDKAAEYVQKIALAIQYAHEHGILHRDLKPSNVLIDASDEPMVMDFGLAKQIEGGTDLTTSGSALGSPPYMSPEQAAGKKDEVGPSTDVYAIGAILYELITGHPPFEADSSLETLYKVMETEPTAPRLIDRDIPHDLETICLKCLSKDPGDRYDSAQELANELGRFLQGEPILARPLGAAGGSSRLTWYVGGSIVSAIIFALWAPELAAMLYLGGEAFLRLLKMIVVPLVMVSVMSGVLGMGDVRKLGRSGGATFGYFLITTVLAVLIGLLMVNLIQPGSGAFSPDQLQAAREGPVPGGVTDAAGDSQGPRTLGQAFESLVLTICTDNLFRAMADGELLPLIVFSIIFAGMLTTMSRRAETISRFIQGANHALMKVVMLLMKLLPFGVFCLVAAHLGRAMANGRQGFYDELWGVAYYMMTVLAGLAVHFFVILPLALYLLTRRNPYRFLMQMSEALMTAFSTASSSATLPVTMECAEKRAKVARRSTEFVLPLGATVNMDGTAMYQACAAVFIAQAFGIMLGPAEQLTIVVTATLASVAAAGIPQAGLFTMLIVLNSVGVPLEGLALIISVDWLLDRFRTTVNVFSDSIGAAVVQKSFRG